MLIQYVMVFFMSGASIIPAIAIRKLIKACKRKNLPVRTK